MHHTFLGVLCVIVSILNDNSWEGLGKDWQISVCKRIMIDLGRGKKSSLTRSKAVEFQFHLGFEGWLLPGAPIWDTFCLFVIFLREFEAGTCIFPLILIHVFLRVIFIRFHKRVYFLFQPRMMTEQNHCLFYSNTGAVVWEFQAGKARQQAMGFIWRASKQRESSGTFFTARDYKEWEKQVR